MTPEMAARAAKLLNTNPDGWLRMQQAVDLQEVAQKPAKLGGIKPTEKRLRTASYARPDRAR